MPELPEVETVRRGLAPVMEGVRIAQADVRRPDLRWPFPPRMADRLTGATVLRLRRRSKYILADLDTGETLLIHLGMSGRMLVSGAQGRDMPGQFHHSHPAPEKHDHVVLDMDGGARVTFNDARRFGAMDLMDTASAESHPLLAVLGPEPLGNAFDGPMLAAALKDRRTPIKAALLDQRIVAGLGNIYVCEVLFRAGISPKRQAGRIATSLRGAGPDHPGGAVRRDRGGRIVPARPSPDRRGTRLFSTQFQGIRARRRGLRDPRLLGNDPPDRAVGPVELLLPVLSKIA